MELINEVFDWAFARHTNILSWYIRPLFLLPLAYFAWRRSGKRIVITFAVMMSSMVWFPAPEVVDPRVEAILEIEKDYLTTPTLPRILYLMTAPLSLGLLLTAFWKRSLGWGLVMVNAMVLGKALWSIISGGEINLTVLVAQLSGLAVCNAVVVLVARRLGLRISLRGGVQPTGTGKR
jgi:hypothetical protein